MATAARQSKAARKGAAEQPNARRPPAWGSGARASPTFSPTTPRQQPAAPAAAAPAPATTTTAAVPFPPLAQSPPQPTTAAPGPRDRVLQALSGLTGTTVTLVTKSANRYEGVVGSVANTDGDTAGVTLKDVKDVASPGAPLKESLFVPSTNIDHYTSGPADARPTNGDSFRTDTDITQKKAPAGTAPAPARERDLQAWVPSSADPAHPALAPDEDTFGQVAANGATSWDQFSVNEQLFGVKASFDEDLYTTKLDRSAPDFKERERKAQRIANEIIGAATNNTHIAEERGIVDDSGANEEDKYGAVVRGQNAYVPPGARKGSFPAPPTTNTTPATASSTEAKADVPKVSINGPDGAAVSSTQGQSPPSSKAASPAPTSVAGATKPPADPLPAFRDFVKDEKQRLTQKRQALVKSEMEKRMADLVKFSQSFKLNKPIPEDLVPILAKDEDRQRQIKEKAKADASSTLARAIGPSTPATASRGVAVAGAKVAGGKPGGGQGQGGGGGGVTQALAGKGGAGAAAAASGSGTTISAVASGAPAAAVGVSAQKTVSGASHAAAAAGGSSSTNATPAVKPTTTTTATTPAKPAAAAAGSKKISMVIQSIPPFKGPNKGKAASSSTPHSNSSANGTPALGGTPTQTPTPSSLAPPSSGKNANGNGNGSGPSVNTNTNANGQGHGHGHGHGHGQGKAQGQGQGQGQGASPISPNTAANRWNVNASAGASPAPNAGNANPNAKGPSSGSNSSGPASNSVSPKPKPDSAPATPNPFFGTRPIKKSTPVHVKDDFNPFKHNKVVDASQVAALWPYSGKRYIQMFPQPQHAPAQHAAHMVPPVPPPMPPPSYEEVDSAAAQQAAQQHRGYVYAYPPYGYPPQHMMPGMAPPGPPGAYMPGPYMQPMPYPPGMPPPNAMYSPAMGQMPRTSSPLAAPPVFLFFAQEPMHNLTAPQAYMQPPPPGVYPPPPPNGAGGPRPSMPPTPIPSHAHPYYHQSPQLQHAYPMMMPPPPNIPPHAYEGGPAPPVPMGGHA
ncbi:hypothetical protein GALMADRAFT_139891 [Galerina marginata CBS 339.88]|uniref:LsmAD domain-containing protein n=1 Tax=Galerina marginata (strain CBS 339.88) TaxID=685588 RepID=A0A067SYX9_GALM3|nr:hypothetical protein GALMADRAFT_139891 [Galerina marginata CBS 339.88]